MARQHEGDVVGGNDDSIARAGQVADEHVGAGLIGGEPAHLDQRGGSGRAAPPRQGGHSTPPSSPRARPAAPRVDVCLISSPPWLRRRTVQHGWVAVNRAGRPQALAPFPDKSWLWRFRWRSAPPGPLAGAALGKRVLLHGPALLARCRHPSAIVATITNR